MAWSYIVAVAYLIICLVDGHDGVMRTVVDGVITRTSLPPATEKQTRSLLTFESVTLHPPNDTSDTVDTHNDLPNPQITIALPEEETTATTKAASTTRFRSIFSEETVDSRRFMTIALPGEEPTTDAAPDTTTTTITNFQPAVGPLKVVTAGLSNDDTTAIPTSVPTNNTSTETKEDLTRFAAISQPGENSTSTTLTITSALNPVNSSEAIDGVPKLLTVALPEETITTTGAPIQPIHPSTKTTTELISTTVDETTQTTTTTENVEPHRLVTISVPVEGTTTSTTTATKGPVVGSAVAVARLPVAVWLASLPEVSQSRDQNIPIEDITVEKPQKKDNPTLHSQEVTRRSSFAPTTTPTIATTTTSYLNSDEQITVNLMNKDLFTDSVDITANETLRENHSLNTVTSSNTTQYLSSIPTTTTTAATKETTRLESSATTTVPHTPTTTVLTTTTSTAPPTTTPIPVTFTTVRSTTTTTPVLTTTRTVPTMITRPPPILRTAKLRPRLRTTTALPTTVWSVRASMRKPLVRKIHHTSRRIKHRKGLRKFRGKYHRRPLHRNRHQKLRRKFAGNFSTRRRVSKKHLSSRMARLNSLRLRRRLQGSRPHLIELYGRTSVPPVHHRARTPVPHRAWTRRDRSKRQTHMLAQADINSAENRMRSAIDIINKLHDSEENDADPIFDKLQKDSWAPSESVMVRPLLPPQN